MTEIPEKLKETLEDFAFVSSRSERAELLIDMADHFQKVPERVAVAPYPEDHRVPYCESEAYVWSEPRPDGTLKFYFAVENPQGMSAMALATILDQTLSGAPLNQVTQISPDIVLEIFGKEISMGKGQGLMGMVSMVKALTKQHTDS